MTSVEIGVLAREAGRSGRNWMDWTADDAVQSYVFEHEADSDVWEQAWERGRQEYLRSKGWVTRWTTAPADYDTFGTRTVSSHTLAGESSEYSGFRSDTTQVLREILVDFNHVQYQEGRNSSGLHPTWIEDPRIEALREIDRAKQRRIEEERRAELRVFGLAWLSFASDQEIETVVQDDTVESRGITYSDVRVERKRRAEVVEIADRTTRWKACWALVPIGGILVDDGEVFAPSNYGTSSRRPSCVYYDIRLTDDWDQDPSKATVMAGKLIVGCMEHVADWIKSGRLRVVQASEVPPEPVMKRLGLDRLSSTKSFTFEGETVWVGYQLWVRDPLILSAKGRLIRRKSLRDKACQAYYNKELKPA